MKSDRKMNTIASLQKELKRVETLGHIVKISTLSDTSSSAAARRKGLEVFLDMKMHPNQTQKIVNYITQNYNLDTYYYTKSHSIKIWFSNAK